MKKFIFTLIILFIAGVLVYLFGFGGSNRFLNDNNEDLISGLAINLNKTPNSRIPFVIQGEGGQKIVAFKKSGGREIEKLVFSTNDDEAGTVIVGDNGLPATLEFSGYTVRYLNYTDSTVDILIEKPDGQTEVFKESSIVPPLKTTMRTIPFVSVAYADSGLQMTDIELGLLEDVKAEKEKIKVPEEDFYIGTVGQILGVLGCGTNIGLAVASGGTLAPLAWIGCGALVTRIVTVHTEIGSCQGDVFECAKNTTIAYVRGTEISGAIREVDTNARIKDAVIRLYKTNRTLYSESKTNLLGNYTLDRFGDEIFIMRVTAPDMTDITYKINSLAGRRLVISDTVTKKLVFDSGLGTDVADFDNTVSFDIQMSRVDTKEQKVGKNKKVQSKAEIWQFTYKQDAGQDGSKNWEYNCNNYSGDGAYYIIDGSIMMDGPRFKKLIILGAVAPNGTVKSFMGMDNQSSINGALNVSAGTGSGTFFVKKGSDPYDCSGTWTAKRNDSLTDIQRNIVESRPQTTLTP